MIEFLGDCLFVIQFICYHLCAAVVVVAVIVGVPTACIAFYDWCVSLFRVKHRYSIPDRGPHDLVRDLRRRLRLSSHQIPKPNRFEISRDDSARLRDYMRSVNAREEELLQRSRAFMGPNFGKEYGSIYDPASIETGAGLQINGVPLLLDQEETKVVA